MHLEDEHRQFMDRRAFMMLPVEDIRFPRKKSGKLGQGEAFQLFDRSPCVSSITVTSGGARKRIGGPQVPVPRLTYRDDPFG